jgi:hypothetical protein
MSILIVILLVIIAYILWRIYRQREDEKEQIANEKIDAEYERKKKEKFKDYPHLYGNIESSWIEVFSTHSKNGIPLLKIAFLLYLHESTKIDLSPGSFNWDTFWDFTEELLEHLEKFHEGTALEHEIAICTYWQLAATSLGELIEKSPNKEMHSSGRPSAEIEEGKLAVEPYTDIAKIASWFPKKANHPAEEISFTDEKGKFPRESKGSAYIHEKLKALGL